MVKTRPSTDTNTTKPSFQPVLIGRVASKPLSTSRQRKPTSVSQLRDDKIMAVVEDVFKKYQYESLDIEALIFCILQKFEVNAHNYEVYYKMVRRYIISNFNVTQGKHLLLQEVSMRRMMISFSHTE